MRMLCSVALENLVRSSYLISRTRQKSSVYEIVILVFEMLLDGNISTSAGKSGLVS